VFSIRCPVNSHSTIWLCFSNLVRLLDVGQIPKVHLASQVTESSNHRNLRERANLDSVSVSFSKLEKWVTIFVIQSWSSRLNARNHNELLASMHPCNVLNHVFKNGNKLSVSTAKDLHVLEWMLTVVAFTRRIY
jgi:hypothetical protein